MMIDQDYVCGDYGTESEWTQVKVTVKLERLDDLVAIMSMVSNNLQIEDYSDIDLKTCYVDLIDESILNADKTIAPATVLNAVLISGVIWQKTAEIRNNSDCRFGIMWNCRPLKRNLNRWQQSGCVGDGWYAPDVTPKFSNA